MVQGALNTEQLDAYCRENGFVRWFETSAKDGTNVEEAANFLVREILATESQAQPTDSSSSSTETDSDMQVNPANQNGSNVLGNQDGQCAC